jgi:hypothetical protein
MPDPGTKAGRAIGRERTIDRIEDLAIGRAGSALLDLGIVDLEELIEPRKEL